MRLSVLRTMTPIISTLLMLTGTVAVLDVATAPCNAHPLSQTYSEAWAA